MSAFDRPIIADTCQLRPYDLEFAVPLAERLKGASLGPWRTLGMPLLCRLFECFLQVTDLRLVMGLLEGRTFNRIGRLFVGAIYSDRFIQAPNARRYKYARLFIDATEGGWSDPFVLRTGRPTPEISSLAANFERLTLNTDKEWLWRGWRVQNSAGQPYFLPLLPLAKSMGRDFVDKIYGVVNNYHSPRRAQALPGLREFALFLSHRPVEPKKLLIPGYMKLFWKEFWEFYLQERRKFDKSETILKNWVAWKTFARSCLIPSGLIAPLLEDEFSGPGELIDMVSSGNEGGGANPPESLLIALPDSATDSEAWRLLLVAVPESLKQVELWATKYADDLYARCQRRISLARDGKAHPNDLPKGKHGYRYLLDARNPQFLQNASATLEQHGYPTGHILSVMRRNPAERTAYQMGIPMSKALIPHATLIALSDAKITTAFLDDLHLFDVNGKQVGFLEMRGIWYLTGVKRRRGKELAQQRIKLTPAAAKRVAEVIEITAPLRAHLKRQGSDKWRLLFLETGGGFGVPKPVNFSKKTFHAKNCGELAQQFAEACSLPLSRANELAKRFTLRNVRVTLGVNSFITTHSESEAAHALGHHEFNDQLLARYVPPELVAFYRERWVRAFQHELLIFCAPDENAAMRATGFKDKSELHAFMKQDGYRELEKIFRANEVPKPANAPMAGKEAKASDSSFVLNANVDNLVALMTIKSGAEDYFLDDGERIFWKDFSRHMLRQVEERQRHDARLEDMLIQARGIVDDVINLR